MGQGRTHGDDTHDDEHVTGAHEETTAPGQPITHSAALTAQIEEALRLYCQGMTVAATARAMDQAETSVRRWIRLGLATLAGDTRAERRLELQRLIESQRAVARAAWESYYEERTRLAPTTESTVAPTDETTEKAETTETAATAGNAEHGTPCHDTEQAGSDGNSGTNCDALWLPLPASGRGLGGEVQTQKHRNSGKNGKNGKLGNSPLPQSGGGAGGGGRNNGKRAPKADNVPPHVPPRVPQGARFLALALAAQREVARLQGLYEKLAEEPAPMSLTIIRRPDGPENQPPTPAETSPDSSAHGEDADGR